MLESSGVVEEDEVEAVDPFVQFDQGGAYLVLGTLRQGRFLLANQALLLAGLVFHRYF